MKKMFYVVLMFIATLAACTSEDFVPSEYAMKGDLVGVSSQVTLNHVKMLTNTVGIDNPNTRSANNDGIICITGDEADTLLFVVNHPVGGWTMYASGMRVPAVVAESEKGRFDLDEAMAVYGAWLEDVKEDMKTIRQSNDEELNFTSEEIMANIEYWLSVCDADACVRMHNSKQTRTLELLPTIPTGHYELDTTYMDYTLYDTLAHLTQTRWHQESPYNYYCPERTDVSGVKAYAGCVAIAGAQMIYYLHHKLGVPQYIPDSAYCIGDVDIYTAEQLTRNIDFWQTTPYHGNNYSEGMKYAPLVANIGFLVGMDYGNEASSAHTGDLVDVLNHYGIDCQYVDYDEKLLHRSLTEGMPVIAKARYSLLNGHAFIIDGYKRRALRTTYVYKWVSNMVTLPNPDGSFRPVIDPEAGATPTDSLVHTYSNISLTHIRMNWGWGETSSDVWFAPTGDWIAGGYNINRSRKMIYDFKVRGN